MSLTNLTSAGQFAALGAHPKRRVFCGDGGRAADHQSQILSDVLFALSENGGGHAFFHRFLISYGVTDEVFGVSACREGTLSPFYAYGLIVLPSRGGRLGRFWGRYPAVCSQGGS